VSYEQHEKRHFAQEHIEDTGNTELRFLEGFKSDYYADVSLGQWLALTPPPAGSSASEGRCAVHLSFAEAEIAGRAGVKELLSVSAKADARSCFIRGRPRWTRRRRPGLRARARETRRDDGTGAAA